MSNKRAKSSVEAVIAQLASRQHGVVSLTQLTAAGLHRSVVVRRTRNGRLHRIHRGVYAVGHTGISRRHRLPQPEVNVRVGPFLVDFLWCARRL